MPNNNLEALQEKLTNLHEILHGIRVDGTHFINPKWADFKVKCIRFIALKSMPADPKINGLLEVLVKELDLLLNDFKKDERVQKNLPVFYNQLPSLSALIHQVYTDKLPISRISQPRP